MGSGPSNFTAFYYSTLSHPRSLDTPPSYPDSCKNQIPKKIPANGYRNSKIQCSIIVHEHKGQKNTTIPQLIHHHFFCCGTSGKHFQPTIRTFTFHAYLY